MTDNVKSIGEEAFSWCNKLESIKLSENIDKIEENMFYECESLTSIDIPNKVKSIGMSAFAFCTNLTTVTMGKNINKIAKMLLVIVIVLPMCIMQVRRKSGVRLCWSEIHILQTQQSVITEYLRI